MAHKLVVILALCLLMTLSFANDAVESLDLVYDGSVLSALDDHKPNEARVIADRVLFPRLEAATVTVTETVCGPNAPTSPASPPTVTVPETTIFTGTSVAPPAPTTEQPPTSSGPEVTLPTESASSPVSSSSSSEQTSTTLHTSSSHTSEQTTDTPTNAPTGTTTSVASPTANAGIIQGGKHSVVLALALTIVRFLAV